MNYFDLHALVGKDITPPGGVELVTQFLQTRYFVNSKEPFRYLEVASNTGAVSRAIATLDLHAEIKGIDISEAAVDRANQLAKTKNLSRIDFSVQNAERLEFEDGYFDYVDIGVAWAFFLENRNACLAEAKRVLKQDGILIANNLFYVTKPPPSLTEEVARILELDLDRLPQYDYDYFFEAMSREFALDCELIVEYEGTLSVEDYAEDIRRLILGWDGSKLARASKEELDAVVSEYAEKRSILNLNDQYCLSALQGWRLR
ncbi:class I SAM-dependent methyltransferase [Rhizobium ruizarguesonis]